MGFGDGIKYVKSGFYNAVADDVLTHEERCRVKVGILNTVAPADKDEAVQAYATIDQFISSANSGTVQASLDPAFGGWDQVQGAKLGPNAKWVDKTKFGYPPLANKAQVNFVEVEPGSTEPIDCFKYGLATPETNTAPVEESAQSDKTKASLQAVARLQAAKLRGTIYGGAAGAVTGGALAGASVARMATGIASKGPVGAALAGAVGVFAGAVYLSRESAEIDALEEVAKGESDFAKTRSEEERKQAAKDVEVKRAGFTWATSAGAVGIIGSAVLVVTSPVWAPYALFATPILAAGAWAIGRNLKEADQLENS
jgi:hypothetical protein